jgi:hypothetical protein
MTRFRQIALCLAATGALFGLWMRALHLRIERTRPDGIASISDHYKRFGDPKRVERLTAGNDSYFILHGELTKLDIAMTLPSAAPAYAYDSSGRFIDWSFDPGEDPEWKRRWQAYDVSSEDIDDFRARIPE